MILATVFMLTCYLKGFDLIMDCLISHQVMFMCKFVDLELFLEIFRILHLIELHRGMG